MKHAIFTILVMVFAHVTSLFGQNSIELTFTAVDSAQHVSLDSIFVKNFTQGGDTMLYGRDTTLLLVYPGISVFDGYSENSFTVFQNFPNPFFENTSVNIYLPERDHIEILIYNLLGKEVANYDGDLHAGNHSFTFSPGKDRCYILSATWKGKTKSIKMFSTNTYLHHCQIKYEGYERNEIAFKSQKVNTDFVFTPGDKLLYVGYTYLGESGMTDTPESSQSYTLQFATNIPCPGTPTVTYEGQVYNTIQIFNQCWLKENLNVGLMIPSTQPQANNDTIEKYCLGNYEYYCDIAGGLYFWDEMMKYTNETAGQGICPGGWHIPDDFDWQILEGAVDSIYKIGNPEWESNGWRGSDAGGNLKQTGTTYWEYPNTGATNAFGFTALPGGYFVQNAFWGAGYKGYFWSSDNAEKFYRNMDWNQAMIQKQPGGSGAAFSVRCLKD